MDGSPISLREYLEALIHALDRRVEQRIRAAERAVEIAMVAANAAIEKAELTTERRFEAVNEFRGALNDMVGKMMPRAESEANWHGNAEKIVILSDRLTRIEGAGMGVKGSWGVIAGVVGLGIAASSVMIALLR
jgi:hypothetical protein